MRTEWQARYVHADNGHVVSVQRLYPSTSAVDPAAEAEEGAAMLARHLEPVYPGVPLAWTVETRRVTEWAPYKDSGAIPGQLTLEAGQ